MATNDDLLSPEEIEALMAAARGPSASPPPAATPPKATAPVKPSRPEPPPAPVAPTPDVLLQEAEQNLAAAIENRSRVSIPDASGAMPLQFEDLGRDLDSRPKIEFPIAALQDVELDLRIELGRTELLIEEVLQLREGTVVPLDKLAGDPVDILVNGRLIARGEVLVLNDNFCVRIAEILSPRE